MVLKACWQLSLLGKFQANERPSFKNQANKGKQKTTISEQHLKRDTRNCPLASIYTFTHMIMHTHTCAPAQYTSPHTCIGVHTHAHTMPQLVLSSSLQPAVKGD